MLDKIFREYCLGKSEGRKKYFIEGINYGTSTDFTARLSNPFIGETKYTPWAPSKHKRE